MSKTLEDIKALVCKLEVRISDHGYDELLSDNLLAREVVEGVSAAVIVEDYPDYPKGSCVLVLQKDREQQPIHVVWGGTERAFESSGIDYSLSTRSRDMGR